MRITIIKNRLRAARRLWSRGHGSMDVSAQPGFVEGVMRGLLDALHIVQDTQREDIAKAKALRRPMTRWTGIQLYRACRQALGRLKEGDRPQAMKILQNAINHVVLKI